MKKLIIILSIIGLCSCQPQYTCPTYMNNETINKTDSIYCNNTNLNNLKNEFN
jgi:hypothetical protein